MIKDNSKIEAFQDEARFAFDPIHDQNEAMELIERLCAAAKDELQANDSELAPLFEPHFGYCCGIDDALSEKFPETFADR